MWKLNKYSYKSGYTILMIFGGCLSLYFYNGSDHTPLNLYYLTNHYAGLYGESFYFILLVYRIYIFKQLRSLTLIRLKKQQFCIQLFSQFMMNLCVHFLILYGPTLVTGWSYITSYSMLYSFFVLLFLQYFMIELIALFIIYANRSTVYIATIIILNLITHYIIVPFIFF